MDELQELYREVILDHNRNPRNFGELADATRVVTGVNPLCGDKLTLYVKLDGGRIEDIRFQGSGCAISVASSSFCKTSSVALSTNLASVSSLVRSTTPPGVSRNTLKEHFRQLVEKGYLVKQGGGRSTWYVPK